MINDPSVTTTASPLHRLPHLGGVMSSAARNSRNWSPGPNYHERPSSDPEAAHDLTHQQSQDPPGEGDYWSMVCSRGLRLHQPGQHHPHGRL